MTKRRNRQLTNVDCIPVDLLRKKLGELYGQEKLSVETIEKLRAQFPHSIQVAKQSPQETVDLPFVNCVMYAFNLKCDAMFRAIYECARIRRRNWSRDKDKKISADTEFVEFCIEKGFLLSKTEREREPGDLVVYFDNETCFHVGKLQDQNRIRSKWGSIELFEHDLREVPDLYGDKVKYFEPLQFEQSQDGFIAYAKWVVEDNPEVELLLDNTFDTYW